MNVAADQVAGQPDPCLPHHLRGQVDAVHADAARSERQRNPPGADAELERGAAAGDLRQEVDRGLMLSD